jgi:hypothetical protein
MVTGNREARLLELIESVPAIIDEAQDSIPKVGIGNSPRELDGAGIGAQNQDVTQIPAPAPCPAQETLEKNAEAKTKNKVKAKNRNNRGTFTIAIGQTNAAKPMQAVESAEALAMSIASASIEDNRLDLYRPQSEKSPCQTARSTKNVTQFESLTLIARNSGKDTPVSR